MYGQNIHSVEKAQQTSIDLIDLLPITYEDPTLSLLKLMTTIVYNKENKDSDYGH